MNKYNIQVLFFDIFGTVVDWHGSLAKELAERNRAREQLANVDWAAFAWTWREGFWKAIFKLSSDGQPPASIDDIHREILEEMLASHAYADVGASWSETERADVVFAWHRVKGWPDSSPALHDLKQRYILSTLANGNVRLLIDMAKHADLPWDNVFASDSLGLLKPSLAVYTRAAALLRVDPAHCCMVAAHIYDLRAAAEAGFRTCYVRRKTEDVGLPDAGWEEGKVNAKEEGGEVDMVVADLAELARKM